jgi:hypothetical protein
LSKTLPLTQVLVEAASSLTLISPRHVQPRDLAFLGQASGQTANPTMMPFIVAVYCLLTAYSVCNPDSAYDRKVLEGSPIGNGIQTSGTHDLPPSRLHHLSGAPPPLAPQLTPEMNCLDPGRCSTVGSGQCALWLISVDPADVLPRFLPPHSCGAVLDPVTSRSRATLASERHSLGRYKVPERQFHFRKPYEAPARTITPSNRLVGPPGGRLVYLLAPSTTGTPFRRLSFYSTPPCPSIRRPDATCLSLSLSLPYAPPLPS